MTSQHHCTYPLSVHARDALIPIIPAHPPCCLRTAAVVHTLQSHLFHVLMPTSRISRTVASHEQATPSHRLSITRIARLEESTHLASDTAESAGKRRREVEAELEQCSRQLEDVREELASAQKRVHELEEEDRRHAEETSSLPTAAELVEDVVARCEVALLTRYREREAQLEEANAALRAECSALRRRADRTTAAGKEMAEAAERAGARQHAAESAALKSTEEAFALLSRERETVRVLQRRLLDAEASALHSAVSKNSAGTETEACAGSREFTRSRSPDRSSNQDSVLDSGGSGSGKVAGSGTAGSLAAKLVECNRHVLLMLGGRCFWP